MGPEARLPCPQCGGLIHPIAGRCKHCKTDLVALRGGKPQAQSALPSLGNRTSNDRPVAGPRMPARLGAGRGVALPGVDPAVASFNMGSELPSSRLPARRNLAEVEVAPPVAWPVIVIALSVVAIILSIGVLAA